MWEVEVEIEPLGEISLLKSKLLVTRNFSLEHRGPQSILCLIGCPTLPVPLTFDRQRGSRAFDYGCKTPGGRFCVHGFHSTGFSECGGMPSSSVECLGSCDMLCMTDCDWGRASRLLVQQVSLLVAVVLMPGRC